MSGHSRRRQAIITFKVIFFIALLAACDQRNNNSVPTESPPEPTSTEEDESDPDPPTVEVTRIVVETELVEITPAPEEDEEKPKELIVCLGREPESLYPYSGLGLDSSAELILPAIYESMTTSLSYDFQARGIEKLPSLEDGDAVIQPVQVKEGDRVVNSSGDVVFLRPGTTVVDIDGQAMTFEGEPLSMPQLAVNFTLKPLVWSDGVPVTADDSVYSFELAADAHTPIPKLVTSHTAAYDATGELSLRWLAIPGYLDTSYFDKVFTPYPRHYWGDYEPTDLIDADVSRRNPISHGPFALEEWIPGERIILVKNQHYYLAESGFPKLDTIQIKFLPATSLVTQLLAGECDLITHQDITMTDIPMLLEAQDNGQLKTYFQSGTVFEHIDFGINPVEEYALTQPDWFEDLRVRRAFVICFNRQAVVDELLFGRSDVMNTYVPSIHPLYPEDIIDWPYDVGRANALLDAAGFPFSEEEGIRVDIHSGTPFEVTLLGATGNRLDQEVSARFKQDLAQCGIDVTIEQLHAEQYFADGPEGPLFGRKFDLAAFPWLISIEPNCSLYHSERIPGPENNWNLTYNNEIGFRNDAFDAACNTALEAFPGTAEYNQSHTEALSIWNKQLPSIPLFMRQKVAAAQPGVSNFQIDPTEPSDLWNIYEIDLE